MPQFHLLNPFKAIDQKYFNIKYFLKFLNTTELSIIRTLRMKTFIKEDELDYEAEEQRINLDMKHQDMQTV